MNTIYNYFKDYQVNRISDTNIQEVFELCKKNERYYKYLKEDATLDGVKNIMKELPPNTEIKNKYFIGFYKSNKLIAILDLIDGYPKKNQAFIGLFMIADTLQGQGIGKSIILDLIKFLKSKNFTACNLGVIEDNIEAISFWSKVGFVTTGQIYNHDKYNVVMMNYKL